MIMLFMVSLAALITFALACVASIIGWLALSEMEKPHADWNFVWAAAVVWLLANLLAGWVTFALGGALA